MNPDNLLDGRLKLRHLSLVVMIADQEGIAKAAEALHVTQPVVTRGLREVEDLLEVRLFERGPRGVTPTIYGKSFLEHSKSILALVRDAGRNIKLLATGQVGTINLGIHWARSNSLLPLAIAGVKKQYPELNILIRESSSVDLHQALLSGEIDLIFGRLTTETPRAFEQRVLYREPVWLVARAGNPVHEISSPSLSKLLELPWAFPVEQTSLRTVLEEAFLNEAGNLPQNRIEVSSVLLLQEILVNTDVIAAMPLLSAQKTQGIEFVNGPLRGVESRVGVTVPVERPMLPGARAMLTQLEHYAKQFSMETGQS